MEKRGIIFDIKHFAVHDGPGIRTTIFFKGCPLNCWWCHNPESQELEPVTIQNNSHKKRQETIGKEVSIKEVLEEISRDRVYYEESVGGITFSGGEPLYQFEFLKELARQCKEEGFHTTLDTAGCVSKEKIIEIMPFIDLFLYDLKLLDEKLHIKYTGSSNKEIIENLLEIKKHNKEIIIRIPIIPTVNDNVNEIKAIAEFLSKNNLTKVELIPYHQIGEEKYKKLKKINRMKDISPPTKEEIRAIVKLLEEYNLKIKVEE